MNDRNRRIAQGWDEAAAGYDAYFVPRFGPWVEAAVTAVATPDRPLPDGPILVPCCGTFPELDAIVAAWPDREIVGIDLSAGMIKRAEARIAGRPRISAVVGDAATLDPQWIDHCAAIISVFGLQQLPDPSAALRNWLAALRPDGRMSVIYWPEQIETEGPFARLTMITGDGAAPDDAWERELVPALNDHGAVIERDDRPAFPMTHPDAATFFDAYVQDGPLRSAAITRGDAYIDSLRRAFLEDAPAGEWRHRPQARHLVARHVVHSSGR